MLTNNLPVSENLKRIGGPGLSAEYYDGEFLSLVAHHGEQPGFYLMGVAASPVPGLLDGGDYSIRLMGYFEAIEAKSHDFVVSTPLNVRVWVDGVQIVNQWAADGSTQSYTGSASLSADTLYEVVIELYNPGLSYSGLEFTIGIDGLGVIPTDQLYANDGSVVSPTGASPSNYALMIEMEKQGRLRTASRDRTAASKQRALQFNQLSESEAVATIAPPSTDDYQLIIRYSSTGGDRVADLKIGGSVIEQITFTSTGGFNSWALKYCDVSLNSGPQMLAIESSSTGAPNIDYIIVSETVDPAPPPPPEPPPTIADILFISAPNLSETDNQIASLLNNENYAVTYENSNASQSDINTAISGKDLAIISDSVSSALGNKLKNSAIPVICMDPPTVVSMGMASSQGTVTDDKVWLIDSSNPMVTGLDSPVTIYDSSAAVGWVAATGSYQRAARPNNFQTFAAYWDKNDNLGNNFNAPDIRVVLCLSSNAQDLLTPAAETLILNSINYCLGN